MINYTGSRCVVGRGILAWNDTSVSFMFGDRVGWGAWLCFRHYNVATELCLRVLCIFVLLIYM